MPKLQNRPPKLCKDKNYAIVYYNGTRLPMGCWGTPEADKNYRRFLTEWAACSQSSHHRIGKQVHIEDVITAYLDWAKNHVEPKGYGHSKIVSQFVLELYFGMPVDDFGAKSMTAVQQALVDSGRFSRQYILRLLGRFRTILRWGIGQEMVHVNTVEALKYVLPLRKGQTAAHETKPRQDVTDATVETTLKYLSPVIGAMVQIQRWAVMRPNEVCRMTVGDIDRNRSDGIWLYCPSEHKRAWTGEDKVVPLGKPEQLLLIPFLEGKAPEESLFCTRFGNQFSSDACVARQEGIAGF